MSRAIRLRAVEIGATKTWIVTLDLEEVTQHGDNPMVFLNHTEAQQYALELVSEFGPDANIALIELDEFGFPLILSELEKKDAIKIANEDHVIAFKKLQDQINDAPTALQTRLELVRKAVTGIRSLEFKRELAIGLLTTVVSDKQVKALSSLPAQILVARLRCLLKVSRHDKRSNTGQSPQVRKQVYDDDPNPTVCYEIEDNDLIFDYHSLD